MADSAVALRYAEALHALARERRRTEEVLADLAGFKASLDAEPGAWQRVLDPRVEPAEKEALLRERFLAGRDPLVVDFVRLVLRRRREGMLPGFFRAYLDVHEERAGIVRVEVETATPMPEPVQDALRSRLEGALQKSVVLEVREDRSLLGGLRFLVGSRLVDGSHRSRLERIARGLRTVPLQS